MEIEYCHGKFSYLGNYLATIDFYNNGYSDEPTQHKHLHLIKLINGNFALQPNNRCRVMDKSFVASPFEWDNPPDIETNEIIYRSEVH